MAKLTEKQLKESIMAGKIDPVYLLWGEEKYLVRRYTDRLIRQVLGKNFYEFNFNELDGRSPVEEIVTASMLLPVAAERRCVVVKDYPVDSLSESDLKSLTVCCEEADPSAVLIFTMPTQEGTASKAGKLKKLADVIEKHGSVVEFSRMKPQDLNRQLVAWASAEGCQLSSANAGLLITLCGDDLTLLHNEVNKLCAYAGHETITGEMIRSMSPKNTEVKVYALSDCIAANDYSGAFQHLHDLFEQNEEPEVILSVLSSVFIDWYRAKVASESGKTMEEAAEDFHYGRRSFVLKNARSRAAAYSVGTLREILDVILETDIRLKSKPTDRRLLLETLLGKLMITAKSR